MGERCVFDAIGQSQWTQPQFFTIKSGSPATCPAINKRTAATAHDPRNAFFNAPQLYLSHLIILFPDSKSPGAWNLLNTLLCREREERI
jgi:hypothetical protein